MVAEAQRNGGICAYVDAEHAMDPVYAKAIGVDIDELLISQPDTGEQALEITDMLVRSGAIDVVVIDSVAALTPRAEIEGEMGDTHVGLQARLMSQALRKLTANLNKSDTIALFINQLREKIGVMFGCFSYSTRVTLADGTTEKIGKIVNQKLPVEVLSYDADLDAVVPKRSSTGSTTAVPTTSCSSPWPGRRATVGRSSRAHPTTRSARRGVASRRSSSSATACCSPAHVYLSDVQWQVLLGGSWATARCRRAARGMPPGSAGVTAPSRPTTATGRRPCSPTSASAARRTRRVRSSTTSAVARAG